MIGGHKTANSLSIRPLFRYLVRKQEFKASFKDPIGPMMNRRYGFYAPLGVSKAVICNYGPLEGFDSRLPLEVEVDWSRG